MRVTFRAAQQDGTPAAPLAVSSNCRLLVYTLRSLLKNTKSCRELKGTGFSPYVKALFSNLGFSPRGNAQSNQPWQQAFSTSA
jgi:hypothetical protein